MKYICYRYLYKTEGNEPRFLFGFLVPYTSTIDILVDSTESIGLTNEISLEYRYISEKQYNEFINNDSGMCDFSLLGFSEDNALEIKNITTSFFSQQRIERPVFSSNKYTNWWLEDYSDLSPKELSILLDSMNQYCTPFFLKYSILNTPHALPLGSFLIMPNSEIIQNQFVDTDTSFTPDNNNKFTFTITFDGSLVNKNYTARVRLVSVAGEIMINEVFCIDREIKSYSLLDNMCPKHILEIFDENGNSIYDEYLTRVVRISMTTNVTSTHTQLNDRLSDKDASLRDIKFPNHSTNMGINSIDKLSNKNLEEYNKYQNDIRDLQIENSSSKTNNKHLPSNFWYEKMSSPEAVNKIVELVQSAEKTYVFDPFFSSQIVKNKSGEDDIDDNSFLILNRLSGNVTIITNEKTSKELPDIIKSFSPIHNGLLALSIKKTSSLHDRYLLLKTKSGRVIYSLTNSLSSTMKDLPIGINEIVGQAKDTVLNYLQDIISSSEEIHNNTLHKTNTLPPIKTLDDWYTYSHVKELLTDVPVENGMYKLTVDIIPTLQKNFNPSQTPLSIKLLGLAEILSQICGYYNEFYNFYESLIEKHINEISLEEITKFLIDTHFYTPTKYQIIGLTLPNEMSIESYEMLDNKQRYPSHHPNGKHNIPDGYKELLKHLYYIVPEKLFEYFSTQRYYELQQIFTEVLSNPNVKDPLIKIDSNIAPIQLLSLMKLLKPIHEMSEDTKDTIIKSSIPKHLLFMILLSQSWSNQKDKKFTNEYLEFINNFIYFDIKNLTTQDDKYLSRYSEQLLLILPKLKYFNIELSKKTVEIYLQKDTHIWYTLTTNNNTLHSLLVLTYKINESDKGNFLMKLFNDFDLESKYSFVTSPLAQKLFGYDVYADRNRIVQIMLYIFSSATDNKKALESTLDKITNSLSISLERNYSPYINLNFLLLHGFFTIIVNNKELQQTDNSIKLLEYLANHSPFDVFIELYRKKNTDTILEQIRDLMTYINQFSDTFSSDKHFIVNYSCNTILLFINKYPQEEQASLLIDIENIVNETFKDILSISFNKEGAVFLLN